MASLRDARVRHAAHYQHRLVELHERYRTGQATSALDELDLVWPQVQLAMSWLVAAAEEDDIAGQGVSAICNAAVGFLPLRLTAAERADWLRAARDAALRAGDEGTAAGHNANLGLALTALGDYAGALEAHEQALVVAERHGDRLGEAQDRAHIGTVYEHLGDLPRALGFHERALQAFAELGHAESGAIALMSIGRIHRGLGRPQDAFAAHERALELLTDPGRRERAMALAEVAEDALLLADLEQASRRADELAEATRALQDLPLQANAATLLGRIHFQRSQPHQALHEFDTARELYRASGSVGGECSALRWLAAVTAALGHHDEALAILDQVLALARDADDAESMFEAQLDLGQLRVQLGDSQAAVEVLTEALAYAERPLSYAMTLQERFDSMFPHLDFDLAAEGMPTHSAFSDRGSQERALGLLSDAYAAAGDSDRAASVCERRARLLLELERLPEACAGLGRLGDLCGAAGRLGEAASAYGGRVWLARQLHDLEAEADALGEIGTLLTHGGDLERAVEMYGRALEIDRASGNVGDEISVLANLGHPLRFLGRLDEADEAFSKAADLARGREQPGPEGWSRFGLAQTEAMRENYARAAELGAAALELLERAGFDDLDDLRRQCEAWHSGKPAL